MSKLKNGTKLSSEDAAGIRGMKVAGWVNKEIAFFYKISVAHVSRILRNQRWANEDYDKCAVCKWNKNKKIDPSIQEEEWD